MPAYDEVRKWLDEDKQKIEEPNPFKKYSSTQRIEHTKAPESPSVDDIQNALDSMAIMSGPAPIVGDVIGLAADIHRYKTQPESRTPLNYLFTGAGLLPFVPAGLGTILPVAKGSKIHEMFEAAEKIEGATPTRLSKEFANKEKWKASGATGIFRDPAGNVVFEISDRELKLKPEAFKIMEQDSTFAKGTKLSDVMESPTLKHFDPKLLEKDLNIDIEISPKHGTNRGFVQGKNLSISAKSDAEAREILIHELQHVVQDTYGLPQGTTPETVRKQILEFGLTDEGVSKSLKIAENLSAAISPTKQPERFDEYLARLIYKFKTGEIMANTAQLRRDLPEEVAREIPFFQHYSYPQSSEVFENVKELPINKLYKWEE